MALHPFSDRASRTAPALLVALAIAGTLLGAGPAAAQQAQPPAGFLPPAAGHDVLPSRVVLGGAQLPAGPSTPGVPSTPAVPPTPGGLPRAAEKLSAYVPQTSCDYTAKPGVLAFQNLLLSTYPDTGSYGIVNTCLREGMTSEHSEGRAFDWAVSVSNPQQVREVNGLFAWLFATDAAGNRYAMARRLGIMYMIWNSRIWGAYSADEGWRQYSCSGVTGCHQDHVHFSFGWPGAWQRTSYWSKHVAPADYGPCVADGQRYAPAYTTRNWAPCPYHTPPPAPTTDRQLMWQDRNLVAVEGDAGAPVAVIQRQVHVTADGDYGPQTADAVTAYQRSHGLPTGSVGPATWASFLALQPRRHAPIDFNADGRTDIAVFRPSTATWYAAGSVTTTYGKPGDLPVPGDYNGDGRTDIAVWRPSSGIWYVSGGASTQYGTAGDVPVPADYDGDGRTDLAVFRPSTNAWYVLGFPTVNFGTSRDVPVPGDYNGDHRAGLAVFRPSTSIWSVLGGATTKYGTTGDVPVPADYSGDGRTDLAVFRPSNGSWYVLGMPTTHYGVAGDIPVPGDYAGDGRTDPAVFRPSNATWYVLGGRTSFGAGTDMPLSLPVAVAGRYYGFR